MVLYAYNDWLIGLLTRYLIGRLLIDGLLVLLFESVGLLAICLGGKGMS